MGKTAIILTLLSAAAWPCPSQPNITTHYDLKYPFAFVEKKLFGTATKTTFASANASSMFTD